MVFNRTRAANTFRPYRPMGVDISLKNKARAALSLQTFISLPITQIEREAFYYREDGLPASMETKPLLTSAVVTTIGQANRFTFQQEGAPHQVFWKIVEFGKARFELANAKMYQQSWNDFRIQVELDKIKQGQDALIALLSDTAPVTQGPIGGFQANLSGWNDGLDAQGYDATIFTRQTINVGSTILQLGDFTTVLQQLCDLVSPSDRIFILCPYSFYYAMLQAGWDRTSQFPFLFLQADSLTVSPVKAGDLGQGDQFLTFNGNPIVPIPDEIYTAAGHTVGTPGANSYPLIAYAPNTDGNPDGEGCYFGYVDYADPEDPVQVEEAMLNNWFPLGLGLGIHILGRPVDVANNQIVDAIPKLMKGHWQFVVRQAHNAAMLLDVRD